MSRAVLAAALLLSAAAVRADIAPWPGQRRRKLPPENASGRIVASSARIAPGAKGPVFTEGRLTLAADDGRTLELIVAETAPVTCDGKKAAFEKAAAPGACGRVEKILFDPLTKAVSLLELKTTAKPGAASAKTVPADVFGEIAATDVLAGRISVRLEGGGTLGFKVGDGTTFLTRTTGMPAQAVEFGSLKVGDSVEIRSKDWKTADEVRVLLLSR